MILGFGNAEWGLEQGKERDSQALKDDTDEDEEEEEDGADHSILVSWRATVNAATVGGRPQRYPRYSTI